MSKIDEKVLWKAAEKLRDKCDPADYKNVVLGLVFLKYVSDRYEAEYEKLKKDGNQDDKDYYIADHVFINPSRYELDKKWIEIPKRNVWNEVSRHSKDPSLGQIIDALFIAIEKENGALKGILPKTYSKSELNKTALGELVDFFTTSLNMSDADGDFFGQIYEYYIGAFAKYIPSVGGEFFTPKSIVELMVDILEPSKGRVFDPCCGSGGMFVQCETFVKEHQGLVDDLSIYGQESNPGTWKMAKMNLAIRGIEGDLGEKNADSFTEDLHKDLRADYILANPPYNTRDYWKPSLEGDSRWVFGKPDEGNANYAWLSLMYSKLSPNGRAAILMPNGATTSNTASDKNIRQKMIEEGKVEAILALPNKLFNNVSISVQCWILSKAKTSTDVLFINADELGTLISRRIRVLTEQDIKKIVKAYQDFKNGSLIDVPGFCKKASLSEIKDKDFSLNPGRYVGADDSNKMSQEEIKQELKKTSAELFKLMEEGKELEDKVKRILEEEMK